MKMVAVTGGIASGKSTITQRFAEHGAIVLDADVTARLVVEPGTPALAKLIEMFGDVILHEDGSLNRAQLASMVFGNTDQLEKLNGIVHPAVREYNAEFIRRARRDHPDGVLVYDVPLLAESENQGTWDFVVVAEAPDDIRLKRMVSIRGMPEADARARISSQASNAERRKIADIVIDTSTTLEETRRQADDAWRRISDLPS